MDHVLILTQCHRAHLIAVTTSLILDVTLNTFQCPPETAFGNSLIVRAIVCWLPLHQRDVVSPEQGITLYTMDCKNQSHPNCTTKYNYTQVHYLSVQYFYF